MSKIAVFPGSFDPITKGHEDIILRSLDLFDELIIAVGNNSDKKYLFNVEKRMFFINETFKDYPMITVEAYRGLTVDYCKKKNIFYLLRGLRTSADFEFERSVGQVNKKLNSAIETVFLLTSPEYTYLNSSVVRDILNNQGDPSMFTPDAINIKDLK